MRGLVILVLILALVGAAIGCGEDQSLAPSPTPADTPAPMATGTPTLAPTAAPTHTPASSAQPTPTAEPTATPVEPGLENMITVVESAVGEWSTFDAPELQYINFIERDDAGRMWIATDGLGLTMYDGDRWYNWNTENREDMRDDCFRSMAASEGKVYLAARSSATSGGLMMYDLTQDRWTNMWPDDSELSSGGIGGVVIDEAGRVHMSTAYGSYEVYTDAGWEHMAIEPLPPCYLLSMHDALLDSEGEYWLATSLFGVWRYDGTNWATYGPAMSVFEEDCLRQPPRPGYASGATLFHENRIVYFIGDIPTVDGCPASTNAIAQDLRGQIWVATADGLAKRGLDGTWDQYLPGACPLVESHLQDVAVDPLGRIWTVSSKQLAVYNGEDWQTFAPDVVGASRWGHAIGFDEQGRPWVAVGSGGVGVFSGLVAVAAPDLGQS